MRSGRTDELISMMRPPAGRARQGEADPAPRQAGRESCVHYLRHPGTGEHDSTRHGNEKI